MYWHYEIQPVIHFEILERSPKKTWKNSSDYVAGCEVKKLSWLSQGIRKLNVVSPNHFSCPQNLKYLPRLFSYKLTADFATSYYLHVLCKMVHPDIYFFENLFEYIISWGSYLKWTWRIVLVNWATFHVIPCCSNFRKGNLGTNPLQCLRRLKDAKMCLLCYFASSFDFDHYTFIFLPKGRKWLLNKIFHNTIDRSIVKRRY